MSKDFSIPTAKILSVFIGLVSFMLLILSIIIWATKLPECSSEDQNKITSCAQGMFALSLITVVLACLMFFEIIDDKKIYFHYIILSLIGLLTLILGSIIYGILNSNCQSTSNVQSLQTESEIIWITGIIFFIIFASRAGYLYYYGKPVEKPLEKPVEKPVEKQLKIQYQNPLEELLLAEEQEEANQKEALIQARAALEIARNNNDGLAIRRANIRLKNIENEILKKELEKEIKIQAEEDAIEAQKARLKRGRIGIEQIKPNLTTSPSRPKAISEDVKKILMDVKERAKKEEEMKHARVAIKPAPPATKAVVPDPQPDNGLKNTSKSH
jgi:hypothetical protein